MTIYEINEFNSVVSDALVTHHGHLLFGSFWGRDTAVLEFLSRLQLPGSEGGTNMITVKGVPATIYANDMVKKTGRSVSQVFGNLIHLWIYDNKVTRPDRTHQQIFQLMSSKHGENDTNVNEMIWGLVNKISPYPLLPAWEREIVNYLNHTDCVAVHKGLSINCVELKIDKEAFSAYLSVSLKEGFLTSEVNHG